MLMLRTPAWTKKALWGAIPLVGAVSFYAISQVTAPIAINLSAEPLYAKGLGAKPTLTLALSVEFPTVGAQYTAAPGANIDATYAQATEYLGYYDADSCYVYVNAPAAIAGYTTADLKRFDRSGPAVNHGCGGLAFSGNFMNWATGSAIDVLRLGLTGGDRIVDTPSLTVLQRAVLKNGSFYNDSNFPAKQLIQALALEAVPATLIGTHANDIWVANCLNRVHFGTTRTGNCNAPGANSNLGATVPAGPLFPGPSTAALTSDTFFYSRVAVCDSLGGVLTDTRKYNAENFCIKYPNGNYKPTGNLQKYSDRLRVSAFGYLMDNTTDRYGGVLRAPMKYVGPKTFDANGAPLPGLNPNIEWNDNTGVFTVNPETAAEGKSGVVNYLNQFGRTGATQGNYKTFDPVTELYYEAVRYVQGLDARPEATSGITAAMKDGYPAYDNSGSALTLARTDPHAGGSPTKDYACVKNNIVVIGDVNTHFDKSVPGNTRFGGAEFDPGANIASNQPNFTNWTNVVAGFERKGNVGYLDGNGVARNTNAPNTNAANGDNRYNNLPNFSPGNNNSYLMSGIAYWGNTHDIRGTAWADQPSKQRPGMRISTYVLDVNEYGQQTNLASRRNNQFYLASKYGGFKDKSGGKGNPFIDTAGLTDNSGWETAAGSNLAKNYFLSSSAVDVLKSLKDMFESIAKEGNSIAGASVSTTKITAGGSFYTSSFDPTDWSGKVFSTPLSVTAGAINVGTATPDWEASAVLKNQALNPTYISTTRNIIVGRSQGNTGGAAAIPFKWADVNSDSGTLKVALDKATPTSAADGKAQERLDYLRGDQSKEGAPYRARASLLGDIINSPAVYSKEFAKDVNTAAYKTFLTANQSRSAAVFVGANDGMLHAFNADTYLADKVTLNPNRGKELFAYIPSWLEDKLSALSSPSYNSSLHQSYVDGQTAIGEALVGTDWKTVLISSTGGGGQGVFALDVSNPDSFTASNVMWEFTDRDDPDLGNVMGKPQVLKLRTNKKTDAIATYEWFAVVASGVNNFVNDGVGRFSSTGNPALFLLSLNKAPGAAWSLGNNYYKFVVPTTAALSTTTSPGLINFEATADLSKEVAQIYMGDLHGNMWKLDFATANNTIALPALTFNNLIAGTSYKPLFVAKDAANNIQPISMTPSLVGGPNNTTLVFFGTGKYLESSDNTLVPGRTQSFYAINDNDGTPSYITGRDRLQAGTISASAVTIPAFVWGRASSASDTTQRSGWYIDFIDPGERQISDATIFGQKIAFGSIIPPQNLTDPCAGGSGNGYVINTITGAGTVEKSTVGLLSQPIALETADASSTTSDSTGRRTKTTTRRLLTPGSTGNKTTTTNEIEVTILGRLSWRQINNYQELKNN